MTRSTITTTVTSTVVLGTGNYADNLLVTAPGAVMPTAAGATGVYAPSTLSGVGLRNLGMIAGGAGGSTGSGAGGIAVDFAATGSVIYNNGAVIGGAGYRFAASGMGVGGAGVLLASGDTIHNTGHITGGAAGSGTGGAGVAAAGPAKVTNSGTIFGGIANPYATSGGEGGGAGVSLGANSVLANRGFIEGGSAQYGYGGAGGTGVALGAGVLTNAGYIAGGGGGDYRFTHDKDGANGGAGVALASGADMRNTGSVLGGSGGGATAGPNGGNGGVGVLVSAGATLINAAPGRAYGGPPGYSSEYGGHSGIGGVGVAVAGGTLVNRGQIYGTAWQASPGVELASAGVAVYGGGTASNFGNIFGGLANILHYNNGPGVFLDGGTLMNAGMIIGSGTSGDAVQFGNVASTLVVDPGAVFHGKVAAYASAADTLALAGHKPGSLSGFGTTITGFTAIVEDAKANWTLFGTIDAKTLSLGAAGKLTLNGAASFASVQFAPGGDTLILDTPSQFAGTISGFGTGDTIDLPGVTAKKLHFAHGTLTLLGASGTAVAKLDFAGSYTADDFKITHDYSGDTEVVYTGQAAFPFLPEDRPPDFMPLFHAHFGV